MKTRPALTPEGVEFCLRQNSEAIRRSRIAHLPFTLSSLLFIIFPLYRFTKQTTIPHAFNQAAF
jgi:hypothetical protein